MYMYMKGQLVWKTDSLRILSVQNIFPPVTDFGPPKIGHSAGHKPTKAPNGKAALSSITGPQLKEMKGMEVKNWNKIERAKERVYSSMHKQGGVRVKGALEFE